MKCVQGERSLLNAYAMWRGRADNVGQLRETTDWNDLGAWMWCIPIHSRFGSLTQLQFLATTYIGS